MPSAPAVEPPAPSRSRAARILWRSSHRGRLQDRARVAGVGDDGDRVLGLQAVEEELHGAHHQRQLVGRVHRTRDVEQEDQVAARHFLGIEIVALDADVDQLVAGLPGAGRHDHAGREGPGALGRQRIVVVEVVDQLLDAHGVLLRHHAAIQLAPHEGVGSRVDVDREGRDRVLGDPLDRVLCDRLELVAADVFVVLLRRLIGLELRLDACPDFIQEARGQLGIAPRFSGRRLARHRDT